LLPSYVDADTGKDSKKKRTNGDNFIFVLSDELWSLLQQLRQFSNIRRDPPRLGRMYAGAAEYGAQRSRGRIAGRILLLSVRPATVMQFAARDSSMTDSALCSFRILGQPSRQVNLSKVSLGFGLQGCELTFDKLTKSTN
jgi:hypothetical protein